ncbi:MAG: asparagine synthase (glutamine-hydrolyzing) [Candidatus Nanopelagicales bacterium]
MHVLPGLVGLMCGIVGVLDPRRRRQSDDTVRLLDAMAQPMWSRGPDGAGTWVDEHAGIGFGHRRLSILDLSEHGAQPMASADGRWVITYNGEVYNHPELAVDLRKAGERLRGHSDTEVLVEAIARWGLDSTLDRIDGMYAFGLWDRDERRLTLVRDRMGEKPLYYGTIGTGEVVFGSTLKVLEMHPGFDRPVDRNALALYFRHKYVPAPWTIRQGIFKLEPGCKVDVSAEGLVGEPQQYWSYYDIVQRGATFGGSAEEAVDELDRLLRSSVQRRLVADVPVGAFLSGGIDSTAVVAVAQQVAPHAIKTFTIGSSSRDYDESSDAQSVATQLGTDHTELIVTDAEALRVVEQLGAIHDEPFADSSQVPTRLVAELARKDVSVALSGDGGDELFFGYNRYAWVPAVWRQLERMPMTLRRGGAAMLKAVPPSTWDRAARLLPASRRPRMLGMKVGKVAGVADALSPHDVYNRLVSHWQSPTELVQGSFEPPTLHTDSARWPEVPGIVEHMAAVDSVTYLPDDILCKVDRATMSVSLEGRIPLLDRSIVEFAASLPTDVKVRDGAAKWPLRQVIDRYVPGVDMNRPKSGFGVPIEDWLRGPLKEWAGDHLFGTATGDYLCETPIRAAWNDHQAGRRNFAYELWDVIMYSVWAES